jgi:selenocysteine lyase/cysteine desulfurase
VVALGADFFVTSAYKWSGPHIAACVADPARWEQLRPDKLVPSPDTVPERFEFGTLCFELLAGVTGAVDHLAALAGLAGAPDAGGPAAGVPGARRGQLLASMTKVAQYEEQLLTQLVEGLAAIPTITMCPAPTDRCPTVSFRVGDQDPADIARRLGDEGICVFAGDHYAVEYFETVGLRDTGGAVRASIYHYTTADDVARLLESVRRCVR